MIVLFAAYLLFSVGGLVLFKLGTSCTAVPFFERLLHLRLSWVSVKLKRVMRLSLWPVVFLPL